MLDEAAAVLAFRNRVLTLSVATTGSTTLSATALGFARASGSFISDGFVQGMEISATGYNANNNAARIITGVSAQFLTATGCTVQSATAGRTITCGIPSKRAWENEKFDLANAAGLNYVAEQFVPATTELKTITGQGGTVEETGFYFLTVYAQKGYGMSAIRKYVTAIKNLYAPGTSITAGSNTIKVRGDTSVRAGQIIPLDTEYVTCQVGIPYRAFSINSIAA